MLLSPATNLVRDVYQRFLNPGASERRIVLLMRVAIVALGVVGLVAGSLFPTVLAMALWAYTMYGAGITPALLAALVWPRATKAAGIYSIAAGMSVTLLWELIAVARGTSGAGVHLWAADDLSRLARVGGDSDRRDVRRRRRGSRDVRSAPL